jgi:His-Xaa-Ser system radical SAM maturase HxsB
MSKFHPVEHYRSVIGPYRPLPLRFMRWDGGEVLVVNDVGEFEFLVYGTFRNFVAGRLDAGSGEYASLKAKHMLMDSPSTVPLQLLATKYRTKKSFLDGFTALHLFVVTLRCDHSCGYCQVSRVSENKVQFDMTRETAERAVGLMFRSPGPALKVEFQGGEPLLNFELIRYIVELVEERNQKEQRSIQYVVATNLSPLTDEMLTFFREHVVNLSTSLDGPAFIHDTNRPRRGGHSHEVTIRQLARAREALGHDRIAALMTATPLSLQHPREIIDEYVKHGFDSVFLRWISPYGFAVRTGLAYEYAVEEYLEFYKTGLDYIIELNRQGTTLVEVYTQILLRKILTPFPTGYVDLQSPAGAGIGVVAYNYDGDVYASDEARMLAEMGDRALRLGNVHENSYAEIFGGPTLRALVESSVVETLPWCSECAFAPYCGADPVFHWATQGDPVGHRPTSAFCGRNMAIFRHLFGLLRQGDAFVQRLFTSWATGASVADGPRAEAS